MVSLVRMFEVSVNIYMGRTHCYTRVLLARALGMFKYMTNCFSKGNQCDGHCHGDRFIGLVHSDHK